MFLPFTRRWALSLQYRADRRDLAEMDDHRLLDLGLYRGDLEHGVPFRLDEPSVDPDFRRRGTLGVRGLTMKLYIRRGDDPALRPEDHAVARRAVAAVLAGPGTVCGFAILSGPDEAGSLGLSSWWWDGACLNGGTLDLPLAGGPRRVRDAQLDVRAIDLLARECASWRRHVLDARRPDCAAYVQEDCA